MAPLSKDPQSVSPVPSPALKVAVIVWDAVEVVKSDAELPVSAEMWIPLIVCVAAVVSTVTVNAVEAEEATYAVEEPETIEELYEELPF